MKAFKERAYMPPVDKMRKELGKFNEKQDKKLVLTKPKQTTGDKPLLSNPTSSKKKIGFGAYFILGVIIALSILFIFMVISLIINNKNEKEL